MLSCTIYLYAFWLFVGVVCLSTLSVESVVHTVRVDVSVVYVGCHECHFCKLYITVYNSLVIIIVVVFTCIKKIMLVCWFVRRFIIL